VCLSSDDVIHAGQKYTHSSPPVEECLQITNQFLDWRYLAPFWRNGQKKSENHKIWANLTPLQIFLGEPQNSETSFGYFFSGIIARKILDHAPDPKGL